MLEVQVLTGTVPVSFPDSAASQPTVRAHSFRAKLFDGSCGPLTSPMAGPDLARQHLVGEYQLRDSVGGWAWLGS